VNAEDISQVNRAWHKLVTRSRELGVGDVVMVVEISTVVLRERLQLRVMFVGCRNRQNESPEKIEPLRIDLLHRPATQYFGKTDLEGKVLALPGSGSLPTDLPRSFSGSRQVSYHWYLNFFYIPVWELQLGL
jgi:hypothetical protein